MAEEAIPEDIEDSEHDAELWLERAYIAAALLHDPGEAAEAARNAVELAQNPLSQAKAGAVLIGTLVQLGRDAEASDALKTRGKALQKLGKGQLAEAERRLGFLLFGQADINQPQHTELLRTELAQAQKFRDLETVTVVGAALASQVWTSATPEKPGQLEEAVALVRLSIAAAQGLSDQQQAHTIIAWAGCLFSAIDSPAFSQESSQLLDLALSYTVDDDYGLPVSHLASALQARAQLHARAADFPEAIELADEHAQLCLELGAAAEAFEALIFSAALYSKSDQDAAAVQRASQALSLTEAAGIEPTRAVAVHFTLGQYLLWSGENQAALETLQTVSQQEEALAARAGSRAETLIWRGRAANALQDQQQARECWTQAMDLAEAADVPQAVAMAGIDLAQLLLAARDHAVLHVVERAVAAAGNSGIPQFLLHALDVSGRAKAEFGDAAGLDDLDQAIAVAKSHGADWNAADALDSKGRALLTLGRPDDAAPVLIEASADLAAIGDHLSAAMSQLALARGFAAADRPDDAYPAYGSCLERLRSLNQPGQNQDQFRLISTEFAELLEANGYREAADAVRAGALR